MAARMLTLLLVAVPIAAIAADCAGTECPAESDDSVSLLAHRATGAEAGRRRRKCAAETGHVITMDPLGSALSDFSTVMAQGDLEVELVVGSASKVEVTVDSGLQSYVEASVSGGALSIKFTAPCDDLDDDPKVVVTSPSFPTALSASNDAAIKYPKWPYHTRDDGTQVSVESVSLTATSDSQIDLKKVEVTGTLVISAEGDSKVDTQWSVSPHTKITAQGDSKVEGGSTTTLEVSISGDSEVKYSVTGSASGSVTGDSKLKFKVRNGAAVPDHSAVTTDPSSRIEIDYD